MQVPVLSARNINRLKSNNMTCCMMTCEINNLEIEWSFSPDVILYVWLGSKHQLTNSLSLSFSTWREREITGREGKEEEERRRQWRQNRWHLQRQLNIVPSESCWRCADQTRSSLPSKCSDACSLTQRSRRQRAPVDTPLPAPPALPTWRWRFLQQKWSPCSDWCVDSLKFPIPAGGTKEW